MFRHCYATFKLFFSTTNELYNKNPTPADQQNSPSVIKKKLFNDLKFVRNTKELTPFTENTPLTITL